MVQPSSGNPNNVRRFSVQQYHELVQHGFLTDDDPVELLEGLLVRKPAHAPPESTSTGRVKRHLDEVLPAGFFTRVQEPITLSDGEPEPDVAVARGDDERYSDRHPSPADVPLVVEVADSTLERDRTLKLRSYARAGIPVYWIVNLLARQIEVYDRPTSVEPSGYARSVVLREGDMIPIVLDENEMGRIPVADLLP